jgi:lactoylglutathione lyase
MKIKPAHVAIRTNDLKASRQFYVDLLGFTATHEFEGGENQLLFLTLGTFTIELVHKPNNDQIGSTGVINHFAFYSESNADVKAALLDAGYPITKEINTPVDGSLLLFTEGPNGERIEFMEPVEA